MGVEEDAGLGFGEDDVCGSLCFYKVGPAWDRQFSSHKGGCNQEGGGVCIEWAFFKLQFHQNTIRTTKHGPTAQTNLTRIFTSVFPS
ncbi:hypothetical protein HanIR_Chr06g0297951 [Helianthus annuus]|nr:hypothetical protein HanIR_Chr06g0297951 [Helianthus annuus]